jgi:hypothetical protein
MNDTYELVSSNGAHGGPFHEWAYATESAKRMILRSPTMGTVWIVPRSAPAYSAEHAIASIEKDLAGNIRFRRLQQGKERSRGNLLLHPRARRIHRKPSIRSFHRDCCK